MKKQIVVKGQKVIKKEIIENLSRRLNILKNKKK